MVTGGVHRIWWVISVAVISGGCLGIMAPGPPGKPVVEFPSRGALSEIAARPAPLPKLTSGQIPAEGWTLEASSPARAPDEPWTPTGPWETAFAADAAETPSRPRLTRALSCAARELGRFILQTGAPPPELVWQFMMAACGSVSPLAGFHTLKGDVPDRVSDQEILEHWRAQLKKEMLASIPTVRAVDLGFWFGRAKGKVIAAMIYAQTGARFSRISPIPDANGDVLVEGELGQPADLIVGYVNQGPYRAQACFVDPTVPRPRFRIACHMASEDRTAWIQLLAAAPRRVLAVPFAQLLARRTEDEPVAFHEAPASEARQIEAASDFGAVVIERLNLVRRQAGLGKVSLSPAESASAERVARQYFAAALVEANGEQVDRIALGLLAGWDVGGEIRDGQFMSSVVAGTRDAGRWLASALALPLGRWTMMAPEIEQIALGPLVLSGPDALAAVVTGYRFHHGTDHRADLEQVYRRLVTARKRMALDQAARIPGLDKLFAYELQRVNSGQTSPRQALDALLARGVERFGRGMRGYVIETTSLESLEIPEAVVRQPRLLMDVGVTHYKPPGAAWAQLVIFVVFVDFGFRET